MDLHFDPQAKILAFAKDNANIEELQFIVKDPVGIQLALLEGGLCNYVFRVQSKDGTNSIIVKYAEEKLRLAAGTKMDVKRQELEFAALSLVQKYNPGSAPQPFCFDPTHQMMAMEDLGWMNILGGELRKGNIDVKAAENIGNLLANMHESTSKYNVDEQLWKEWEHTFWTKCETTREEYNKSFISLKLFDEKDTIKDLTHSPSTESFRKCAKAVRDKGIDKKLYHLFNEKHCFIHADTYWNSVFVKDGQVKLFDFEFSFLGHPAQSLGWMVGSYLLCMLEAIGRSTSGAVALSIFHKSRQAVESLLKTYIEKRPIFREQDRKGKFMSETALFVGQLCIVTFIFVFQNENMINLREEEKPFVLLCGQDLLMKHDEIKTIEELLREMFMDRNILQMV